MAQIPKQRLRWFIAALFVLAVTSGMVISLAAGGQSGPGTSSGGQGGGNQGPWQETAIWGEDCDTEPMGSLNWCDCTGVYIDEQDAQYQECEQAEDPDPECEELMALFEQWLAEC